MPKNLLKVKKKEKGWYKTKEGGDEKNPVWRCGLPES